MCPTVNLGPHFSKGPCRRIFILKNSGRRHQSLVWSTEGFSFSQRPKRGNLLAPLDARDMKFRVGYSFFHIGLNATYSPNHL